MKLEIGSTIEFMYTNWKGELSLRKVFVYGVYWDNNEWHEEKQWLLHGLDEDRRASRFFALKDMQDVVTVNS